MSQDDFQDHPALVAARDDMRTPGWLWAAYACVLAATLLASHFYPWGFAPHP